jgi:hypothetical protein
LREANLSGANLSHANLRIKVPVGDRWIAHGGIPLKTEKICNPALLGANFSRANLKDAEFEGIELNQIVLCETTMPDGSVSNAKCPSHLKKSLWRHPFPTSIASKETALKTKPQKSVLDWGGTVKRIF